MIGLLSVKLGAQQSCLPLCRREPELARVRRKAAQPLLYHSESTRSAGASGVEDDDIQPRPPCVKRPVETHLTRLLSEAHDQGVAIGPAGGAVVEVLDDNRLLAGVAARQEDDHLRRLQQRPGATSVARLVAGKLRRFGICLRFQRRCISQGGGLDRARSSSLEHLPQHSVDTESCISSAGTLRNFTMAPAEVPGPAHRRRCLLRPSFREGVCKQRRPSQPGSTDVRENPWQVPASCVNCRGGGYLCFPHAFKRTASHPSPSVTYPVGEPVSR